VHYPDHAIIKKSICTSCANSVEEGVRIAVPPCFGRIALLVACAAVSLIGISCESQSQRYRSRDGALQRSTRDAGTTALPKRPDQNANDDDDDARQRFWDNYNESRAMKEK
jgi:hypothetical protein